MAELEFDRGFPTEDVDEDFELRTVDVDLADGAVEICKRTRGDPDLFAHFVRQAGAHLLFGGAFDRLALAQPFLDLASGQRCGLRPAANETGNSWRVAHDVPRLVIQKDANQQVARPDLFLDDDFATVLELDDVFHRNDDFEDPFFDVHRPDPTRQVLLDLVLVSGVRVDHKPAARAFVRAELGRLVVPSVVVPSVVIDFDDVAVAGQRDVVGRADLHCFRRHIIIGVRVRVVSARGHEADLGGSIQRVRRRVEVRIHIVGRHGSVVEEEDGFGPEIVGAEDQRGHEHHGDQHDDRRVDDLAARGPGHPTQLTTDLGEELGRTGPLRCRPLGGAAFRRARRLVRALFLGHAPHLSVLLIHRFGLPGTDPGLVIFGAGQEGLEPPTAGFGDRSSAKLSYCPPGAREPGLRC